MSVQENLNRIHQVVKDACKKENRDYNCVNIIAVTKYVSIERAKDALASGIQHIGENRVEEALKKWEVLGEKGTWHFIGSLQSKKVKKMIHQFDYIHSLDRLSLAKEIDKRTPEGETMKCFVQVNVSGEETKSGIKPEETISFIHDLSKYKAIEVVGLMTMAPIVENAEEVRPYFRQLRELKEKIEKLKLSHAPCHELSMGMSNDFAIAVEEGATFIRIGTALVGKEE
ncbi:YggS family pyridoxal phosphate-dependent enzyme [Evansella cellulosilytica]|uniref:Pyridoxal phosphate homeostasis protein n=1 Tax=Evansella cellulosilytica (strain ATCC 21833 / DSM 2522 / FERM P-1141 / JCM 9156 / N-4) TaxID=649639 RepID=E6TTR8_EVAC2|nr:YggS family pyridoxal phosphate-dependent enzyme [Evansella cellulosilytica]ADU30837.1 alanine racemase domain protein [Evansella cellulosilytica DSM 2522]